MNFTLTPAATKFIRMMIRSDGDASSGFRLAESRILLDGVTIDFADTPAQTGLVFKDPKQVSCSSH